MNTSKTSSEKIVFISAIFIAGLCSLIYELLISTTSSYFLGDSVKQFSLTIGVYMAAMGVGSFLSKYIHDDLLEWFIKVEVLLGLVGGMSVPFLYFTFDRFSIGTYQTAMLALTFVVGVLTGFEVPILIRLMKKHYPLKANLANVLGLDYIGALAATLLFPFILLPYLGTFRSSLFFGLVNIALGLIVYRFFTQHLSVVKKRWLEIVTILCIVFFILMGVYSGKLLQHWEDNFYSHQIIYSKQTPYQKLIVTKNHDDVRLYINRVIQFSSRDEYRYHEALALVPLHVAPHKKKVLILGGGEGLLARELLKHPDIQSIKIIDLDPEVFRLAKENAYIRDLNEHALFHSKVESVADDAMRFLKENDEYYDIILADLPDPSNESLARLYSTAFFKMIRSRLAPEGVFVTQASSTFHTLNSFWCIYESVKASGFAHTYPYHAYVPSFGDWGFVLAAEQPLKADQFEPQVPCKFLDPATVKKMFHFEKDIENPGNLAINKLDKPVLLDYFLDDFQKLSKEKKKH